MRYIFIILLFIPQITFSWNFNNAFESYGDTAQIIMPLSALYISISEKDYKGSLQFSESFAFAQGSTLLLKNIIKEKRPDGGKQSFPSGHTMSAFTSAAFIDQRYNKTYKYWYYGAAVLVGISRITSRRHYTHDVVAGALIGIYSNKIFTQKINKTNLSITPYMDKNFYALTINYRY